MKDWISATDNYQMAMNIIWKKEGNYTQAKLKAFQTHIAIFGNLWVKLHQQRESRTRYIWLFLAIYMSA